MPSRLVDLLNNSLKAKAIVVVLMLFGVCTVVMTSLTTGYLRAQVEELLSNQQLSTASYVAADLEQRVNANIQELTEFAATVSRKGALDAQSFSALAQENTWLLQRFQTGVVLITAAGDGVADFPKLPERATSSYAALEYFQDVTRTRAPAIGAPRIGRFSQQPVVATAVPVFDASGNMVGMIAGYSTLSDSALFGQVEKANVGQSGWIIVASPKHNRFVSSSDRNRILDPLPVRGVNPLFDRYVDGFEGSGITVNSKGIEVLSSAKAVPSTGWIVVVALPTREAFALVNRLQYRVYAVTALLSTLVATAMWLAIRGLLKPLGMASAQIAAAVESGGTVAELPVGNRDEVGLLLTAFNDLLAQRSAAEEAIRQALQTADKRVRELSDFNTLVVSHSPLGIIVFAPDGHVRLANPALAELVGGTVEQLLAQNFRTLPTWQGTDLLRTAEEVLATGEHRRIVSHYTSSFGRSFWFEGNFSAFTVDGERHLLLVVNDISDRMKAQQEALQALDLAERANRTKSEFIANFSHELRTPLNAVIGFSDALLSNVFGEQCSPRCADYLTCIHDAGDHLLSLVSDILDISVIEAGHLEIHMAEVDLPTLLEHSIRMIRPRADKKAIAVQAEPLAMSFRGDEQRLRQVLVNLLINAVKFTPGGGRITLSASRADTDHLNLVVADTGIGMDDAGIAKAMTPFGQLGDPVIRQHEGVGLGLPLSRRLVELHGGSLAISSTPGRGTTVTVRLPIAGAVAGGNEITGSTEVRK